MVSNISVRSVGLTASATLLLIGLAPPATAQPQREENPDGVYNYMFPSDARQIIVIPERDYFRATNKKVNSEAPSTLLETMFGVLAQVGTTRNPGRQRQVRFKANSNLRYWIILDCPTPARFEDFNEFDHNNYESSEPIFQCSGQTDAR
jgi:hypothetical protein